MSHWHALNTKYNVLFNGEMALIDGLKEIETKKFHGALVNGFMTRD